MKLFEKCRLCPRDCGINRRGESAKARSGFCRQDYRLRVAHVGAHFGEEPPISGTRGSGTVFFSGCSLRCSFCQNYQISLEGEGEILSEKELYETVAGLIRRQGVHNINFVTPDHFFPYAFMLVDDLRENGYDIPILYNTSGYQSVTMLKMAEDYADIYLPDYKYSDPSLAKALSKCDDYPGRALEAISEMVRQKGFLDATPEGRETASRGVLVRHLILPGKVRNSLDALTSLFLEFGPDIPISLMSQYHPVAVHSDPDMNRRITAEEFDRVYQHCLELGLKNMFIQFPMDYLHGHPPFLPDFQNDEPFPGNSPGMRE
ncbi:MAG: radical SAM protein [Deltaproteobacteria bacterium]|nr:radical SAM protein [Deltaproteobacteria bacterium]